jgi:O-antigen/teichoic acid export membrane protein
VLSSLIKNSAWGVFGTGAGRILHLLAMILLARCLSLREFGYFGLIQATLGMFAIFAGAGLGVTATRYVAELRYKEPQRARLILGLVWSVALFTSTLILAVVLLLSGPIAQSMADEGDTGTFRLAFAVGGLCFAFQTLRGIQDAILTGLERFRDAASLKLCDGLAFLFVVPWFALDYGLLGALIGQIIASCTTFLISFMLLWHVTRKEGLTAEWVGLRKEWAVFINFSLPSLMSNMTGTPVLWLGIWLLSQQPNGIEQIAFYNAAYQWHGPLVFVPMVLCSASMPTMVRAWAAGGIRQFRLLVMLVSAIALALGLLPALGLIALREPIMRSYGADYVDAQNILVLILLAAPLHALANIGASTLQSMNRAWIVMQTTLLWGASFLVVTLLAVPRLGSLGLALALSIAYAVLVSARLVSILVAANRVRLGS